MSLLPLHVSVLFTEPFKRSTYIFLLLHICRALEIDAVQNYRFCSVKYKISQICSSVSHHTFYIKASKLSISIRIYIKKSNPHPKKQSKLEPK